MLPLDGFLRVLRRAGWPPVVVLVFHALVARTPWREPLDFTMHFLGGASIAFLAFHALELTAPLLGRLTAVGRGLFSFAVACTIGLFWEFAERASDFVLDTRIQISIPETMSDLIADAFGATVVLLPLTLHALVRRWRKSKFTIRSSD